MTLILADSHSPRKWAIAFEEYRHVSLPVRIA